MWEGERLADAAAAAHCFSDLYAQFIDTDEAATPPVERIAAFVAGLLERWPDLTENEDSPWSTGPLISEARGPLIYFPMSWGRAGEASAYAAELAASMGLNYFDPQARRLRP